MEKFVILLLLGVTLNGVDAATPIDVCILPKVSGPCNANFPSWYYNSQKKCESFIYGGCEGNANRFVTEFACRLKCADPCTLPNNYGPFKKCKAYIPRWWYNFISKQCEPFIFGGCFGTRNNFPTEEACYKECDKTGCDYVDCSKYPCPHGYRENRKGCRHPMCACKCPCFKQVKTCKKNKRGKKKCVKRSVKVKCPKGEKCEVEIAPYPKPPSTYVATCRPKYLVDVSLHPCRQKPDSGCGTKKHKRWYFHYSQGCKQFFYTGVGGNENNFQTEAQCKSNCSHWLGK